MKPRGPVWRVGEGWDTHVLVVGRKLILGGVEIAHTHGLLGHSDADALCHAITDALFGAAALGDIGHHFPDTDAQFRGADSLALLAEAARRVRAAGFEIGNVDSTVIAQAPRMSLRGPTTPASSRRRRVRSSSHAERRLPMTVLGRNAKKLSPRRELAGSSGVATRTWWPRLCSMKKCP